MPKVKSQFDWKRLVKSKVFIFGITLLVAVVAIVGYFSFAGSCILGQNVACPTVQYGSRGETVKVLQKELNKTCFGVTQTSGSISVLGNLSVDGIFGDKTKASVKNFQKEFNLVVDGIVGPKTWSKLQTEYNKAVVSSRTCN